MSVITNIRKWLFGICSNCERKAYCDVFGVRYCERCLSDEYQRVAKRETDRCGADCVELDEMDKYHDETLPESIAVSRMDRFVSRHTVPPTVEYSGRAKEGCPLLAGYVLLFIGSALLGASVCLAFIGVKGGL